ncbi:MAG: aminoglycoside N(3)-acetyltransferase [Candidatus Hermodarchaeota archaeon]
MEYDKKKETEKSVVNYTIEPNTIASLKHDFKVLGVKQGANVILHVSLSKIGWIIGGSVALLKALMETLTEEGTLVMTTFTGDNSDPAYWENPPVPESWWETIRKEMPAFEPEITPSRGVGKVAETFRSWPGVLRSNHPIASFAAWGKNAKFITENHKLEVDLGEGSPISRLYDLYGQILLIGVSHINNSSLHLAEYRSDFPGKRRRMTGSAVKVGNRNQWVEWEELNINSDDFDHLGKDFELIADYKPGKIGLAESRLISIREIVDFGVEWLKKNRKAP